jgi:hypothetical protein
MYDVPLMVARGYASLSFLYTAAEYINDLEVRDPLGDPREQPLWCSARTRAARTCTSRPRRPAA